MARRPRYSRWRRLPQTHRTGEYKLPLNTEPQRLTVYLPEYLLDAAEVQARRAGIGTIQEYCAEVLGRELDANRIRDQVADVEARNGPLEGLLEIANDPEYLAEWSAQSTPPEHPRRPSLTIEPGPTPFLRPSFSEASPGLPTRSPVEGEATNDESENSTASSVMGSLDLAAQVIRFHACQLGDDPAAFLACLRRGESAPVAEVAELARALQILETESRERPQIDRGLAFALHRLAYEGQVLHTDAWPGAFDAWTVDALRAVQEAVERVLSGQDIRYDPTDSRPEDRR